MARGCNNRLVEALTTVQQILRRIARMHTRATHPNTFQLLLALTTEDAEPDPIVPVHPVLVVDSPVQLPVQPALRAAV